MSRTLHLFGTDSPILSHKSLSKPSCSKASCIIGSFLLRSQSLASSYLKQTWKIRVKNHSSMEWCTRYLALVSFTQDASWLPRARRCSSARKRDKPPKEDRFREFIFASTDILFTAWSEFFSNFSWLFSINVLTFPYILRIV